MKSRKLKDLIVSEIGIKRFLLYIAFVMMFSFVAGIVVNFVV